MGPFGHCAVGLAAKPVALKVPLVVLLLATEILDIFATAFVYAGVGNVWEWVQDWHSITYYSHSPESDPQGPITGEYRVARGGSWRGVVRGHARVSSRYMLKPDVRSIVVGFRCVRELVP